MITILMLEEILEDFSQWEIQEGSGWGKGLPTWEVLYIKAHLGSELRNHLLFLAY